VDAHLFGAFLATCLLVSLTPGLCSMLCMGLATTIGVRRTQWMMVGELAGMGSVAVAAVLSIAAVLHLEPALFMALKIGGAAYLVYVGWKIWQHAPEREASSFKVPQTRLSLAGLGFTTAVTNPKVWALYVALLPPFVDPGKPLTGQLAFMLVLIVAVELSALYLYAFGGRMLARILDRSSSRTVIGRVIGVLMAAMGLWILAQ
jgi:threonine/homoserine/homoserine lactone efflux protein